MRHSARANKYNNRAVIVDGHRFPSRREADRYAELKLLERAGKIEGLCLQVPYPLEVNGQVVTRFIADFTYRENGKLVVADAKGFLTDTYRLKKKMMRAQYGIEILEL